MQKIFYLCVLPYVNFLKQDKHPIRFPKQSFAGANSHRASLFSLTQLHRRLACRAMRSYLLTILGFCIPLVPYSVNGAGKDFPLKSYVPQNGPALNVLVAVKGRVVYSGSTGFAHIQKKFPAKPEHRFNMASVSKHFTAMAVLLLEGEGKINTADSIRKYLPDLPKYAQAITRKASYSPFGRIATL
ncbi:MAG: serine hydrolase domain-containing protein [Mesorhizobium sp.]